MLRLIALGISLVIAAGTGASMMVEWPTLALFWYAPGVTGGGVSDPIFGKPLNFFLFTLPAWQLIAGWLLTLAILTCVLAGFFILITGGSRVLAGQLSRSVTLPWRGLSITFAFLLLIVAMRVYISRFELLLEDHTIFGGVTYTDAHVTLTGLLVVCAALVLGAVIAVVNAVRMPRGRWLVAAILPAAVCYLALARSRLVRQQLHRQAERTGSREALHCLQHRLDAAGLWVGPRRAARISGRDHRRRGRPGEQSGYAAEYPPVGLARAAGHAASDSGNPHLLRLSRHRHRSL